jgi:hydrogenase maturation protease
MLGDDGVGWHVAEAVEKKINRPDVAVDSLALGGIGLMERLVDYDRAIIIDVINTGQFPRGSVNSFPLEALANPFYGHLGSAHETNLQTALEMGRLLGASLPRQVTVVAIESPYVFDFSDTLTEPVAAAVPVAAQMVLDLLENGPIQEEV